MTLHFDTSYESIAEDIETGVLTLTVESVEIKELNLPPRRGGETKRHRLLKGNAGKMLKELGEAHVIVERARHEWSLKTSLKVS